MAAFLRLALWNADGLQQHKQEITTFLNVNKIDIMLISEAHFTTRSYLKIPEYVIYHTQYPDGTAHGGTAIIVKRTITHHELSKYEEDYLQATSIQVEKLPNPLTISAIYCPPRHKMTEENLTRFFDTLGPRFLAGGDYNAKHTHWGSRLITTRGRVLDKAINEKKYSYISTGKPTYWPTDHNKIPDLLDFFVTNGVSNNYVSIESSYDLSSDHSPIILTISSTTVIKENPPTLFNKNTNWEIFREHVDNKLQIQLRLQEPAELEEATNHLIKTIQEAGWAAKPSIQVRKQNYTNIPLQIKQLLAEKRRSRAIWQRTHNPLNKTIYNRLSNKLKVKLNEVRNEQFEQYIGNLTRYDHSLWKATRGLKQRPKIHIAPIRNQAGGWARSEIEKAEVFAQHLAEVFTPHNVEPNEEIEEYLDAPLQLSPPIRAFSPGEIKKEIKLLNNRKAPGFDLITAKILKELPRKGITMLTILFNSILRLSYWPTQIKFFQIVMILKPGKNANEATSYRPISLLSLLSKLLEKLILKRIEEDSLLENCIPNHQFGFRHHHSTIQQCHRLTDVINKTFEDKKYCPAVFLDVSQAFDKVWHKGLLCKIKTSFPHPYYLLFKSYLADRYFQVKIGNEVSTYQQIQAGVPQGSVLGPMFYVLYTADLPLSQNTITRTFADDTAILASDTNPEIASQHLQEHLNNICVIHEKMENQNQRKQVSSSKLHLKTTTVPTGNHKQHSSPPIKGNQIKLTTV